MLSDKLRGGDLLCLTFFTDRDKHLFLPFRKHRKHTLINNTVVLNGFMQHMIGASSARGPSDACQSPRTHLVSGNEINIKEIEAC